MKKRSFFQNEGNYYVGVVIGMVVGYCVWQGSNFYLGVAAGLFVCVVTFTLLDIKDKIPTK